MKIAASFHYILCVLAAISLAFEASADSGSKELYIPAKVFSVPDGNDYNNDTSEFCYRRMVQSDNIAIFWSKEFGNDPSVNPDTLKRFNVQEALKECDRFYSYYVNDLKLVQKGKSLTDKYKMLLYVIGGNEQTAFGGGEEDKVGILWTPAVRMHKAPYGALAHELGHSFQYLSHADAGRGPTGSFMEMSAQYMLWQVYPDWMRFENYHLVAFLKQTNLAFLHPMNMYHSPYVLEYWSEIHGKTFYGELCRSTEKGEDPVTTYKRLTGVSQEQFNDEIFDAARKFITWDLKRIDSVARPYANQHTTRLNAVNDGWYQVDSVDCPQSYGYNGIALTVPAAGTKISVDFKGMTDATGYNVVNKTEAGWRYGFLASKKDGSRVYSNMYSKGNGKATFVVPDDTEYLWMVVSGAPTKHTPLAFERDVKPTEAQWPYRVHFKSVDILKQPSKKS